MPLSSQPSGGCRHPHVSCHANAPIMISHEVSDQIERPGIQSWRPEPTNPAAHHLMGRRRARSPAGVDGRLLCLCDARTRVGDPLLGKRARSPAGVDSRLLVRQREGLAAVVEGRECGLTRLLCLCGARTREGDRLCIRSRHGRPLSEGSLLT